MLKLKLKLSMISIVKLTGNPLDEASVKEMCFTAACMCKLFLIPERGFKACNLLKRLI